MRIVVKDEPATRWLVDRRMFAAVAFALALISIVALPGIAGRNTAGGAVRGAIPPPPAEGQCRDAISTPEQLKGMVDAVGIVSCDQPHSAEIILVRRLDTNVYPTAADADPGELTVLDQQCSDVTFRWVSGVRAQNPYGRLDPRSRPRVTLPSPVQWAYGQRWASCQVLPASDDYPIAWNGTARLASFKQPPPPFATCADEVRGEPVGCQLPHAAEQLTWSDSLRGGDINRCFGVVSTILNTKDPTYGGALAVVAAPAAVGVECWIRATKGLSIVGTLIDHGAAPLPQG